MSKQYRASKLKLMVYNLNASFSFAHTNKRSIKNNEIRITNKPVWEYKQNADLHTLLLQIL